MGGTFAKGERISRADAGLVIAELLTKGLGDHFSKLEVAGSYRRGKPDVGDIEFVGILKNFDELRGLRDLHDWCGKHMVMRLLGRERISGIYNGVQVDLDITTPTSYGSALLYFTGSATFNVKMRSFAKSKGMLLNQKGLWKANPTHEEGWEGWEAEKLAGASEAGIFQELGIDWIDPENRDDNVVKFLNGEDGNAYKYQVPSSDGSSHYEVIIVDGGRQGRSWSCSCPHFQYRAKGQQCKHIKTVLESMHRPGAGS